MAFLFLGVTIFFWGTTYRASAIAAEHAAPLIVTAVRCAPAAVVLLLAARAFRHRLPDRSIAGWTAVTGLLMVALTIEGISEGSARAGAANAAVLLSTSPFYVLILERLVLKERVLPMRVLGLAVGFGGIVLIVSSQLGDVPDEGNFVLGMALALVGAVGWAGGVLLTKVLFNRHPGVEMIGFTAAQYMAGSAVLLPLAFAVEGTGSTDWADSGFWGPVVWLALGSSAIANTTLLSALKRLPPTSVTAWLFLNPVVAVIVDVIYGKSPTGTVLLGMGLAIAGVAIVNGAPALTRRLTKTAPTGA